MPYIDYNKNGKHDLFDSCVNMQMINRKKEELDKEYGDYFDSKKNFSLSKDKEKDLDKIVIYDASKDSHGKTILKSFLVTLLCIGGMAVPFFIGGDTILSYLVSLSSMVLSIVLSILIFSKL